jgi:predicted nucleic acid-binding protein
MNDKVFLDTNILIYGLTEPKSKEEISKREIAINLLQKLINESHIFVSVQILNELHINIASALQNGCNTLYSEDMQNGLLIENQLQIVNRC